MSPNKTIALVAHDNRKIKMVEWVNKHREELSQFKLVATEGTARVVGKVVGLNVQSIGHGPLGGDIAVAYKVLTGKITCLIFFIDTQTPHGHEHDIQALIRAAVTQNIPFALNAKTADLVIAEISQNH